MTIAFLATHLSKLKQGEMSIAIYHLSIKIISRGKGKSAVAAAAYRAGEIIKNEYDGITHDYTRKGGIVHTEILLPDNAPSEYIDRSLLWNAVEKIEKAKNSQLAREIEIALPIELTQEQNINLVREYVKSHFIEQGMCADICIHDTGTGNPHAHIMLTMRPLNEDRTWGDKQKKKYILDQHGEKIYDPIKRQYKCDKVQTTDWNERHRAEDWREAWGDAVNRHLENQNHPTRLDHRSYTRQGIEQLPTIHLGVAAHQMEKRGIRTERGDINREIEVTNQKLRQLKARISKLQNWLKEEAANTTPPTLADIISDILSRQANADKSPNYQALSNAKNASKILTFLQENQITDIAGLDAKLKDMIGKRFEIRDSLKTTEQRLKTLSEHIRQADNYREHQATYKEYKRLTGKKKEAFYKTHRREISLYKSAKAYLESTMKGKTTIPTKAWKDEYAMLIPEIKQLNHEYTMLKYETAEVERIRTTVYDIMRHESHISKSIQIQAKEL